MRYLYGDSSSFPLNENFLETLAAATDCAVALLTVDEIISRARDTSEQAHAKADRELADLERMAKNVARALSQEKELSEANQKVVQQVASAAKTQFDRARDQVTAWRDATIHKAKIGSGAKDVMEPLHTFFTSFELPYTSWGLRWRAGQGDEAVQAQVYAIMQQGLTATMGVAIPERHRWAQPVRVSQLEKKLTIQLMGKNWLGKEKMRDEHLDKLYVTKVTRTAEKHVLTLQRKAKEASPGLRITFRDGDRNDVTVQRLDEANAAVGELARLDGIDALALKKLWRKVEEGLADLVHHRAHLLAAELYGNRITELETPAPVAGIIVQAVAPLCRDIVRHSRTPGELQLKRDLGDGRREELFIGADSITNRYASLTPKNRELFEGYGIVEPRDPRERVAQPQVVRAEVMEEHPVVQTESYPPMLPPPPVVEHVEAPASHEAFLEHSWDEPPTHWSAPPPPPSSHDHGYHADHVPAPASSHGHRSHTSEVVPAPSRPAAPVTLPPPSAPPVLHRPLPAPSAPPTRRREASAPVYQLRAPRAVNG